MASTPTSATGTSAITEAAIVAAPIKRMRHDRARRLGFTLIEISVVLLIIGILATFLVLSIGERPLDDRMHNEATRLQLRLELAEEEAQLKGEQLGLEVAVDGYRFLRLSDKQQWVVDDPDGPLQPRRLPEPFRLALRLDGHAIKADALQPAKADSGGDGGDKPTAQPQILILSSGETTAFTLDVLAPGHPLSYQITGDALGRLKIAQQVGR